MRQVITPLTPLSRNAGGYPDDLQTVMGWSSSQMLRHYAKATATDRAVAAQKRLSPSDRLTLR